MAASVRLDSFRARTNAIGVAVAQLLYAQWQSAGLWDDKTLVGAAILTRGQERAAALAATYTREAWGGADLALEPAAFAGLASDGRPLDTLLQGAAVAANLAAQPDPNDVRTADLLIQQAKKGNRAAKAWLLNASRTQVADSSRAALRAAMALHDKGGIRVANPPCCGRCAILHGRHYRWNHAFQRHPGCDCTMRLEDRASKITEDDEIPLDMIRGLSQADRQAVEMGADLSRVVNAHRGMYTAEMIGGQRVKATLDLTMHRDARFSAQGVRLRPEAILGQAKDRDEALALLRRYGYLA